MSALTKPIALDETLQRVANALEEISETTGDQKADKVQNAVSGNFAGLDATGNLTDSGCKPSDFLTAEDIEGKLDAPEGTGTVGQSPRIASGGGMEWASVGAPTDAQVETAVSDWLDNHPEATTTVEDGSITKVKLDSSLQQTVDEVGDLKSALSNITGVTSLAFTSNKYVDVSGDTISMSSGSPVMASSNNFDCSAVACSAGDVFTIYGTGGSSSARLWAITDTSGNILSKASSNATASGLELTMPTNAEWFIVNASNSADYVTYNGSCDLDGKVRRLFNISNELNPNATAGSYIDGNGKFVTSVYYKYTDPVWLDAGTKLYIKCGAGSDVAVLSLYDEITGYSPVQMGSTPATDYNEYTYNVQNAGNYVFCYYIGTYGTYTLTAIQTLELVDYVEKGAKRWTNESQDVYTKIEYHPVKGKYIKYTDGSLATSTNYSYTEPIYLHEGDYILINAAGDHSVSIVSSYNVNSNAYTPAVVGIDPASSVKTYTFTVPADGYYAFSYRSATAELVLKKKETEKNLLLSVAESDNQDRTILNYFNQREVVPNLSIKAFKTLNYSDGTLPKYSQVLWNDPAEDAYYVSSNLYSERIKIFTWDSSVAGAESAMYQAVILPNGDILFVYQTQFDHPTDSSAQGSYRKNPIIYQAGAGFKPVVIDFGSSLKPTGWLQNVGAHYSYTYNRLYISEYTRANESYAHVWAVDMPVTDVSNWNVLLEKEIITPYGDGFKHFHTAQEDPFTNILYFSSGDLDDSSQVWYSTDGASTALVALDDPNAGKYRMLNMAFTPEYAYWASDQWEPGHFLWKCSRNESTGILDAPNGLTKILEFDDETPTGQSHAWVATYATVYLPMFNALLFLDRDDHGEHKSIPVRIYDIDSETIKTVAEIKDITDGSHQFGFRNVAVMCYPKSNEVAVSYDKNTPNYIKMLGNTNTGNRINNIIMRIYKNGSDYSMTFDTVY